VDGSQELLKVVRIAVWAVRSQRSAGVPPVFRPETPAIRGRDARTV
jgi:hypothetical protein